MLGVILDPAMELGEVQLRNVFSTLESETEYSIPVTGCIIGVGFDGIALVVRKTGIEELLQGPRQWFK
jgi:hypothetical protein